MSKVPGSLIFFTCFLWLSLGGVLLPHNGLARTNNHDYPRAVRLILAKAGKLISHKDYDQAIDLLTAFLAEKPAMTAASATDEADVAGRHHTEIYYTLGTCYLMQNEYPLAVKALERAVKQNPKRQSAWLNLAKTCYELQDYPRAGECFAKAYEQSGDNKAEYLYYSAVAFLLAKQYQPSITLFEQLIADHPEKIQANWRENVVHAMLSSGQSRSALPHIQQLAEQYYGEKQLQWQEILLQQYIQLDMPKEALTYALSLTEQAPTQAKWWKALASIHLQSGQYQSALTTLLISNYLEPLTEQGSKLVADLYLQLGIPGKAAALYQVILGQNNTPQLLNRLVLALRQLGQAEQALTILENFAQLRDIPELLMQKADILYELGKYQEAAKLYTQTAKTGSQQQKRALQMAKYAMQQAGYMDNNQLKARQSIAF